MGAELPAAKCEVWFRSPSLRLQTGTWDGNVLWTRFGPVTRERMSGYEFCVIPSPDELAELREKAAKWDETQRIWRTKE